MVLHFLGHLLLPENLVLLPLLGVLYLLVNQSHLEPLENLEHLLDPPLPYLQLLLSHLVHPEHLEVLIHPDLLVVLSDQQHLVLQQDQVLLVNLWLLEHPWHLVHPEVQPLLYHL